MIHLDVPIRAVQDFLQNVTFSALKQCSKLTKQQTCVNRRTESTPKALVCAMVRDRVEQVSPSQESL